MVLSEATRPTSHMKIKKRCAWKKEHETLTLGKRLRGQPEKKRKKMVGDWRFGGLMVALVISSPSKIRGGRGR